MNVVYVMDLEKDKVNVIVKEMFQTVQVSVVEKLNQISVIFVMDKESLKTIVIVMDIHQIVLDTVVDQLNQMNVVYATAQESQMEHVIVKGMSMDVMEFVILDQLMISVKNVMVEVSLKETVTALETNQTALVNAVVMPNQINAEFAVDMEFLKVNVTVKVMLMVVMEYVTQEK